LGSRKGSSLSLKVTDHILDDLMKILIQLHRVVPMDPCDQIGTLPNIGLILLTPFNPMRISIDQLHS